MHPAELDALFERHVVAMETADAQHATGAMVIAEVYRDTKKRSEPFTQRDFMPNRRGSLVMENEPEMTVDETIQFFALLNAALGGEDLRAAS